MTTEKTLFSFGHGYSAQALEKPLMGAGWRVYGTTRSPKKAALFESRGVSARVLREGQPLSELKTATHLLVSAAPDAKGDPVFQSYFDDLNQAASTLRWIGYLSTTGVYGDHGGAWVDEKTPVSPSTKRGEQRVQAERQWIEFCESHQIPLVIFRLAGIYGPGRGPFEKVKSGSAKKITKPNQVFSRIHVDDIAQTVVAALYRPEFSGIVNVCDNLAAPPQDVIGYAASLLGLPQPEEVDFETAELSPMARSFYSESKRVRNDRLRKELGVVLKYPDYKTGLKALAKAL